MKSTVCVNYVPRHTYGLHPVVFLKLSVTMRLSAIYQREIALEMLVTMDQGVNEEGDLCLRFRLKEEWKVVTLKHISDIMGFRPDAPDNIEVSKQELKEFWLKISPSPVKERKKIINPIIKIIHRFITLRVLERLDDTKVNTNVQKWLYIILCRPMAVNPVRLMFEHLFFQRNKAAGLIGFGHYLTTIAMSISNDLVLDPTYSVIPASIYEMSLHNGKYVYGNAKEGYKVEGKNYVLPDRRLSLFNRGKEDWFEEFLFTNQASSSRHPPTPQASEWESWNYQPQQPQNWSEQFRREGSGSHEYQGHVEAPEPINYALPHLPPPATFHPRRARGFDQDFIDRQPMPQRELYGIERNINQNYQLIDQMQETTR